MEPSIFGARLASGIVAPLIRKLFVDDGTGADLVDKPIRLSGLVSFKGEKRILSDREFHAIAAELVKRAAQSTGIHDQLPAYEQRAVAHAVVDSLRSLGDIDMDDIQAVQLGHMQFAQFLRAGNPRVTLGLSSGAVALHASVLETACLHILNFFTQRSSFVARTLVEQSRRIQDLSTKIDTLISRTPSPFDSPFEERYAQYIKNKYQELNIFGLDSSTSIKGWPLDAAYLSLDATSSILDAPSISLPAEQILARQERVLLRGLAGSGKTTLVQWLAVSTTRKDLSERLLYLYGLVPFVLPLRTLTRGGEALPTPSEFLSAVGCPIASVEPQGWFDRVLTSGRGLLLIDGLDEIPESERDEARQWLRELICAYPNNRWLVTSRPSAVREDWLASESFVEMDMAPMSRASVGLFIQRWHEAAGFGDKYGEDLQELVRFEPELARLATNPLMCALICALHHDRNGYLPEGRKEVYDAALSMLLARRDRERGISKKNALHIGETHQVQLIQRIAYWMIRNGRSEMDRSDAIKLLEQAMPAMPQVSEQGATDQIYNHLIIRSGLLREPGPSIVDFIHKTFQDYLGAKAAVEALDFDFLIGNAHLDQWEDVIRMAVAHARPNERIRLLRGMIDRGDSSRSVRNRLHLLAAACLEHATELAPSMRSEVEQRASALIPPRTVEQARALAEVGPVVLQLLKGPEHLSADQTVRAEEAFFTVWTASHIAGDSAIPLLHKYRNEEDLRIRSELARAWNRFDTHHYADKVVTQLQEEGLYFPVSNPQQLGALAKYDGRSRIHVTGKMSPEEILQGCNSRRLTHLWIGVDLECTWEWVASLHNMHTLTLDLGNPSLDLSSLASVRRLHAVRVPINVTILGSEALAPSVDLVREDFGISR